MWCCSISPNHNPASSQQLGRRALNIGPPRVFRAEAQVSIPPDGLYTAERMASS